MRLHIVVGCLSALVFAQGAVADEARDKLLGVWKLDKLVLENVETKQRGTPYGERPSGYLVVTPERFTALITGQGRKVPQTEEDRAASFQTMIAYTGPYTIEGDRLTTKVDVSWHEAWTGTDQVRFFRFEGDRLFIESAPTAGPPQMPGLVKGILEWSRSK